MSTPAADIRMLVLDVDGVLTDGSLIYSSDGEDRKVFSVRDGLGIRLLLEAGIQVVMMEGLIDEGLHAVFRGEEVRAPLRREHSCGSGRKPIRMVRDTSVLSDREPRTRS